MNALLKGKIIVFLFLLTALTNVALAQSNTPAGTVRAVLLYEQRHDNARDKIFNRRNLNIYKKWITPQLYRLFLIELARENKEAKLRPDEKPYFGDGMDFGPMKEYCKKNDRVYRQQFSLRKAIISGRSANVPVSFFYNKACGIVEPTIYRFKLVRRSSTWLIDDIIYDRSGGTLRKDLRRYN